MIRRASVDLGTSSTCVAVSVDDAPPQVVLIDGSPLMSSAVHADGHAVFVGAEAERQAAVDPARFEPHPKQRIDEGSLLLGDTVISVQQALRAVLVRAVAEARAVLGGAPLDQLVLTHPADWAAVRLAVLVGASNGLAHGVVCVPEPVAAAAQHARTVAPGTRLAVLDVGGGTSDVTVLARTSSGFQVLDSRGDSSFGGVDVDQALLEHVGLQLVGEQRSRWQDVLGGRGVSERRTRRALTNDVRGAKETLSRHSYADVPMPAGLPDAHVTRDDLEALIAEKVTQVVELLAGALREVGALDSQGRNHASVYLVGGSSRIPLVARLVHQRLGVLPVVTDAPETVVARGALLATAPPPVRSALNAPDGLDASPRDVAGGDEAVALLRRRRRSRLIGAAVVVTLVAATGGFLLLNRPGARASPTRTVQAQHASMVVPASWREAERTEDGQTSRLVLSPDGNPQDASRLLLVQTQLTAGADIASVAGTLGDQLSRQRDAGRSYDLFEPSGQYAGRPVVRYREQPGGGRVVDWFVVVSGGYQLSVGCGHVATDVTDASRGRCEQAVASVRQGNR